MADDNENNGAVVPASEKQIIDFSKPGPPVPVKRSVVPIVATVGTLGAVGGVGFWLYKRNQQPAIENPGVAPPPIPPGQPSPQQPAPQQPASPDFWGSTNRGEQYRSLLTKIEQVTGMPLRLYLSVVANRESDFVRTARNVSGKETQASKDGIEGGLKRGNPKPQFADSIASAGSGGLFGALAPYVAWTGMDEGYMPYLDADWRVIEDPIVAVICAAKYYQRIVTYYPTVFAGPSASPEDNFRVRLGWANPSVLKESPNGATAGAVRGRMEEDLAELGLKITDLPPPNAKAWPGLKAVVAAMQGFPVTWK